MTLTYFEVETGLSLSGCVIEALLRELDKFYQQCQSSDVFGAREASDSEVEIAMRARIGGIEVSSTGMTVFASVQVGQEDYQLKFLLPSDAEVQQNAECAENARSDKDQKEACYEESVQLDGARTDGGSISKKISVTVGSCDESSQLRKTDTEDQNSDGVSLLSDGILMERADASADGVLPVLPNVASDSLTVTPKPARGRPHRKGRKGHTRKSMRLRKCQVVHKNVTHSSEVKTEVEGDNKGNSLQSAEEQRCNDLVKPQNNNEMPAAKQKQEIDSLQVSERHKFHCQFCKAMPFNSEETLKRHISRHNLRLLPNAEGRFVCTECQKTFKTRANLTTHMWIHREKRFACMECEKRFVQKMQLSVHVLNVHRNEKPYLCSLCGKKYSQQAGLAYHLRMHKSEAIKDRLFESDIMTKHRKTTDAQSAVLCCVVCDESFSRVIRWLYHLRKHLQSINGLETAKRQTIEQILEENKVFMRSQKVYECDLCDHISFYSTEHTLHRAVHTEEKPLQCTHCNKMFGSDSNLKYHIRRTHRRLRCHHCTARFGTIKELTDHQVAEHELEALVSGARYYACKRCDYKSKQRSRLLFHMSHVHSISCADVSKFNCGWCGKSFATKYSQQLHERTHTNERPYVCCVCAKEFSDPSNLIHHGMKSHPEVPKQRFFSRKS